MRRGHKLTLINFMGSQAEKVGSNSLNDSGYLTLLPETLSESLKI